MPIEGSFLENMPVRCRRLFSLQNAEAVDLVRQDDPPRCIQRVFPYASVWSLTFVLSTVQLLMFCIELIIGSTFDGAFVASNGNFGPSPFTLCYAGGKWLPAIKAGRIHRLFVPILLHSGVLHVLSNLIFQLRIGFALERRWGCWRLLLIYVLGGLLGNCLSSLGGSYNVVSVGASGALFALVGAALSWITYNYRDSPNAVREVVLLLIILVCNVITGVFVPNIDNYCHGGGFLGGLLLGVAAAPHLTRRTLVCGVRVLAAATYGLTLVFMLACIWAVPHLGGIPSDWGHLVDCDQA